MSSGCPEAAGLGAARGPWRGTGVAVLLSVSALLGLVIACVVWAATPAAEAPASPAAPPPAAAELPVLRVTADPNTLPFTNNRLEGFENRIAELVARDLGMRLEYVWRAQRRGFFRESLKAYECD